MGMAFSILVAAALAWLVWTIARPDILRLIQGTRYVRARVVRHEFATGDGYNPVFAFEVDDRRYEVRGILAGVVRKPDLGAERVLIYPANRPDLARLDEPFVRQIFYVALAATIALVGDWLFDWF